VIEYVITEHAESFAIHFEITGSVTEEQHTMKETHVSATGNFPFSDTL
jgi:hypothetical protein